MKRPFFVINEIDSDQAGTDTMEFVELYDGGVGNVSMNGKTVVFFNGADDKSYAAFSLNGFFTDANGFFVLGNAGVTGANLFFNDNSLQNGPDAVALYAAPVTAFPNGTSVTTSNLLDAVVYGSGAADAGLLVLLHAGQPQVNENEFGTGTTRSLSRVPDDGDPRKTETYAIRPPTPGALNQPPSSGVLLVHSGTRVDVVEGGITDSYQLALKTIPTANVNVTIDPDAETDLGAGAGMPIVLVFTPANALIPQTVTVSAVNDIFVEGTHTSLITHAVSSVDGAYHGFPIGNVVANVLDNDVLDPTKFVISEIMYNPASDETAPGVGEWIEIVNTGIVAVDLGGWYFEDGAPPNWGAIPAGTILYPNQAAVFFDATFTTAATFRSAWSVPSNALVVGITWQNLSNSPSPSNEILTLRDNLGNPIDIANYDDASPWPAGTVNGPSIYLKGLLVDNNAGANWARSVVGVNNALSPIGPVFATADVGSPGRVFIPGDYNLSSGVDAADYVVWRHTLGSTTVRQADGSGPTTGLPNGVVDEFDYTFWGMNFGRTPPPDAGGGGAGESAVELVSAESSPALVQQPLSTISAQVQVVDTAAVEFAAMPSMSPPVVEKKLLAGFGATYSASTSPDLLLALDEAPAEQRYTDEWLDVPLDSPEPGFAEVDEFFDVLGENSALALFN